MPELPEVETTCRGIRPHIVQQTLTKPVIRETRLRWPIAGPWPGTIPGARVTEIGRRGKYVLLQTTRGTLIIHLGMSGSLRITEALSPPRKHDHYDLLFENGVCLRYHDPRRFGALLHTDDDPLKHPLLASLGIEPLSAAFDGAYLKQRAGQRTVPVKSFIMDSRQVVGVGNIYASESLFMAGIAPRKTAGRISLPDYARLADAIRTVLEASILQGGTTLRDFVNESGRPGYFQQTLKVYGREGQACQVCGHPIRMERLGQRSTYWCEQCQVL